MIKLKLYKDSYYIYNFIKTDNGTNFLYTIPHLKNTTKFFRILILRVNLYTNYIHMQSIVILCCNQES